MNSHLLMASGFAAALAATFSIRRYGLAILFLIALVETFAQFRYPFHVIVRDILLKYRDGPDAKIDLQMLLLAGAGASGAILLLLLSPMLARLSIGRQLMTLGTLIVVAMFGVELISLHHIDAIIYHPVAGFARCAVIYFLGAVIAAAGAWMEGQRRRNLSLPA